VDVQIAIFTVVFGVLATPVDAVNAGGSAWKWLNGGPWAIQAVPIIPVRIKLR
jgi:hypothetical protein